MTVFYAGMKLRASHLWPLEGFERNIVGTCSGAVALATGGAAVPGCSVGATVKGANAYAIVTANMQFSITVASAGNAAVGSFFLDGVNQTALGSVKDSMDQVHDATTSYTWKVPLTAGAHTFALACSKSGAGGTGSVTNSYGTNIVVQIFDLP